MKNAFAGTHAISLTQRDIEIFKLVQSEGAKTSADLDKKFWNEKSKKAHAGFQRIRKLIDAGFLQRGNPKLLYLSDQTNELLKRQSVEGETCHA